MIAIDTNVLIRLIMLDDAAQEEIARQLVVDQATLVPLTVALECEWVLRSFFKCTPEVIVTAFEGLMAFGRIEFEHEVAVCWALNRMRAGADFADMIHLIQGRAAGALSFATFDRRVAGDAGDAPVDIVTL